jgi:RNA polymerase sigma factor (sigma-70 family)
MVKVLLADDHALVRAGIRSLLETAGAHVVGEASDGREALRLAAELKPDVVFMDVAMSSLNGIEATRQIHRTQPEIRVIMLSMHAERQYIYESARAGATGYVLKDAPFSELLTAIEAALAGRTYLSPTAAELAMDDYLRRAKGDAVHSELEKLSAREREVLQLLAEGKSSAEIASQLHISSRTVDTHRQNLMQKLQIHTIAGLTRFAIRHGLCVVD